MSKSAIAALFTISTATSMISPTMISISPIKNLVTKAIRDTANNKNTFEANAVRIATIIKYPEISYETIDLALNTLTLIQKKDLSCRTSIPLMVFHTVSTFASTLKPIIKEWFPTLLATDENKTHTINSQKIHIPHQAQGDCIEISFERIMHPEFNDANTLIIQLVGGRLTPNNATKWLIHIINNFLKHKNPLMSSEWQYIPICASSETDEIISGLDTPSEFYDIPQFIEKMWTQSNKENSIYVRTLQGIQKELTEQGAIFKKQGTDRLIFSYQKNMQYFLHSIKTLAGQPTPCINRTCAFLKNGSQNTAMPSPLPPPSNQLEQTAQLPIPMLD
jgi:hypothetical protein